MRKSLIERDIDLQVNALRNRGLVENIDFRVVYFSNTAEIKIINKKVSL